MLRHYESLNRAVPIQPPATAKTLPNPVPTSNRFGLLEDQPDIIEIAHVVANPSKIL